jgi:hypothetical protein
LTERSAQRRILQEPDFAGNTVADPKFELISDGPTPIYYIGRKPETTAERVRRLQAEARLLARSHIEQMERAMLDMTILAGEIAEGGAAYPVGVREMCSRMADDLPNKLTSLRALVDRLPTPKP